MLRRDRRRAQAAAERTAEPVESVPVAPVVDAEPVAAEPVAAEPVAAEPAEELPVPASDAAPSSEQARTARTARKSDAGPKRRAGSASRSASPAERPARAPRRRPARRQLWQMTGAALAVATLVGGTALPALGMVNGGGTTAVSTEASADLRTQSFTASSDVLPDVVVSGSFSATTPEELVKLQAVAAATAKSGVSPIANPGQIIIPMAAGTYTMTDGFGASRPGRSHMGQDYAAPIGTPIYAAADGVVTMSQDSYGGYGVTVQIQHDDDGSVSTLYGHMNYGTRAVQAGDHVVAGQFLGRVGNTGYTIGSCLHFEVHINGAAINPVPWLEAHVR